MTNELVWGVPSFWIERLPLYFGRHKGFFREHGMALRIQYAWGGIELAQAIDRGAAAIGELGLPPFLMAVAQGMPMLAIGSSVMQQLDHYLVARPGVERLQDLRGKRVGILGFHSCDDFFLRCMLKDSGIDLNHEVEMVPLGDAYGDLACFSSGRIDAGFVSEPFVSLGEERGLIQVLASVKPFFPKYQWGVILVRADRLEEDHELIDRAMQAYRVSCRAICADLDEAVTFGAQVFRVKKHILRRALCRDLGNWELDAQLDLEGLAVGVDIQKQMEAIPVEFDVGKAVCQR